MVTYEIVGVVNFLKISTFSLPSSDQEYFCKIYTKAFLNKIFYHTAPMRFLYRFLQSEN